jgi:hypothetical protein
MQIHVCTRQYNKMTQDEFRLGMDAAVYLHAYANRLIAAAHADRQNDDQGGCALLNRKGKAQRPDLLDCITVAQRGAELS